MSERITAAGSALAVAALLSLAFVVAVPLDLLPWLRGPAPYPPEWQWDYRAPLAAPPAPALALAALALTLILVSGTEAARRRERGSARVLLIASVVLGWCLPLALLAREPNGALRTLLARTTSFSITSYHSVAVSEDARDPVGFVRRHAELLPELARTAKHAATHPPGPVLFFRASVAACERSGALTDFLLATAGLPDRDFPPPLTRAARAGALLGALLLSALAALAAWPLAALARALGLPPLAAGRLALLWSLLPGPALFAPRFDAALALPVAAFAVLMLAALRARRPGRLTAMAALAGACAAAGLALSYGAVAFVAIAGLAAIAAAWVRRTEAGAPRFGLRVAWATLVAAAVAVALAFGVPALLGGAPLRAMWTALEIHHQAYTAPRRYALWLLFDPLDFAAFVGPPIACLALARAASAAGRLTRRRAPTPAEALGLTVLAGLAALVLSGAARGEVGRLWIPVMPLVLVPAAEAAASDARPAFAIGLLVALATFAIAAAWNV